MRLIKYNHTALPMNRVLEYRYDYFILSENEINNTKLTIAEINDLKPITSTKIQKLALFFLEQYIIFYSEELYYKLNLKNNTLTCINSDLILRYCWDDTNCLIDFKKREFGFYDISSNKKNFSLKIRDQNFKIFFTKYGIIKISNKEKIDNYIILIDKKDGSELWTYLVSENISKVELFEDLLILTCKKYNLRTDSGYEGEIDWHNPEVFVVVFDTEIGKEKWRAQGGYHNIDKIRNCILSGGTRVIEYDLLTGAVICEQLVTKEGDNWIESVYYADNEGFYYRDIKGFFGKVRKSDGVVEWEFYLYDENMVKRQIGDFVLLGNGKFVLKTGPLSDANIMCIFDPMENLDFAHIRNGRKVIPKHLNFA